MEVLLKSGDSHTGCLDFLGPRECSKGKHNTLRSIPLEGEEKAKKKTQETRDSEYTK